MLQPVDHLGAELGWRHHLGVVEQIEHPVSKRRPVDDRQLDLHCTVVVAGDDGRLAELVDHPAGASRVDEHTGDDGLVVAECEWVGAHERRRVEVLRRRKRVGQPDLRFPG